MEAVAGAHVVRPAVRSARTTHVAGSRLATGSAGPGGAAPVARLRAEALGKAMADAERQLKISAWWCVESGHSYPDTATMAGVDVEVVRGGWRRCRIRRAVRWGCDPMGTYIPIS